MQDTLLYSGSEPAREGYSSVYISIPAVTAAYDFALTATPFFTSSGMPAQQNQEREAS
jgi:hypothetical protein